MTTEAPDDAAQFRPAGSSQMFVSDSKPDTGEVVRGAQGVCAARVLMVPKTLLPKNTVF